MDSLKLNLLIKKLRDRNNKAYEFFESIADKLGESKTSEEGKRLLRTSFSIVQYAEFTFEEEKLLSEIIDGL